MLLMKISDLEKQYGDRTVVKTGDLAVYENDRIGIVGRNGEGKSTLLKMLVGELEPDGGTVSLDGEAAYIPQLERMDDLSTPELGSKWHVPDRVNLSGGEATRKKIAEALAQEAKLIAADEPGSHLDIKGMEKLEEELLAFRGAVLLIAHDREMLDRICTQIWEVEDGRVNVYEGNYTEYVSLKEQQVERQWFEYNEYEKEKKRLEEAKTERSQKSASIRKAPRRMGNSEARLHKRSSGKQKAKLDKGAKAIQSRIDQLEVKEKPRNARKVTFDLQRFPAIHSRSVINFDRTAVSAGGRELFNGLTGSVKPGTKVAITGANGAGKSTLLYAIASETRGIRIAEPARIGMFYQQLEDLNERKSVLGNVVDKSRYDETFIRIVLARLGFTRESVQRPVSVLSGGEKVKTSLARVFLGDYNLLLLDEPTNFLDLMSREALGDVLCAYPGTVLFVSHDRFLIRQVADEILEISNEQAVLRGVNEGTQTLKEEEERMDALTLDLKLSEISGRLTEVRDDKEKEKLEKEYSELIEMKKRM
ncbi:ribosomal protection-like ABC-F family protein [Alteribacter natronophilus]|uniref:ribosomal protection-like ABC-F family protein n=1 Tax=Alteribacter natronophilus TaxID=2583810 RepID=UPI00110E0693|nr:ABC-F type ribosomal protection protein [Alteribacter natronophilus]TMW70336.1 ABC-F type ribosomal protection protein [Alteribacter natronophilus]